MSLAVTVTKQWWDGKKIHTVGVIVASGTYATGGDTLNFAGLSIKAGGKPFWCEFTSLNGYSYAYSPGTDQTNGKMRVNTTSNTELAAGAYPAGVTGDTINFNADFEIRGQ